MRCRKERIEWMSRAVSVSERTGHVICWRKGPRRLKLSPPPAPPQNQVALGKRWLPPLLSAASMASSSAWDSSDRAQSLALCFSAAKARASAIWHFSSRVPVAHLFACAHEARQSSTTALAPSAQHPSTLLCFLDGRFFLPLPWIENPTERVFLILFFS